MAEQKANAKELKQAVEELKKAVEKLREEHKWSTVYNMAEDIIAYVDKKIERFVLRLIPYSNEMCIVHIYSSVDKYVDEYANYNVKMDTTLRQLAEQFFNDAGVLTRMIRSLAIEVMRAAEGTIDKIEELEQKVREVEWKVRDLGLEGGDP